MILVDINLLLYATVTDHPVHARACEWLQRKLNGNARVGLPWSSLLGYVCIASHPRLGPRPAQVMQAWRDVCSWLDLPTVWVPTPGPQHRDILGGLLPHVRGADVPDAHLAALAIEHGLLLCSADTGFARFPGLHWDNPLA